MVDDQAQQVQEPQEAPEPKDRDAPAWLREWEGAGPDHAGVYVRKQAVIENDPIDWERKPAALLKELQALGLLKVEAHDTTR